MSTDSGQTILVCLGFCFWIFIAYTIIQAT